MATELKKLAPAARAAWLSFHAPLNRWGVGQDVFCFSCDGVWKAEDVTCSEDGAPTCPVCLNGGPLWFCPLPWWRVDLVVERCGIPHFQWAGEAVRAEQGNPRKLPDRNRN